MVVNGRRGRNDTHREGRRKGREKIIERKVAEKKKGRYKGEGKRGEGKKFKGMIS